MVVLGLVVGCGGESKPVSDGTMITPYLAIGETLAADRVEGLPELGAHVIEAAKTHEGKPGVDAMVQGAARVGSPDIATARLAFKKMSDGMIEYLRSSADGRAGLVIVHCTMTFDGKGGLWVQKDGKVMNPYEGAMMLHCGDELSWSDAVPPT